MKVGKFDCQNVYIANIVICYANEDEVIEYSKQLKKQSINENIIIIVVINKEARGISYLKNALDKENIKYEIYCPKENLGYLNGLIYGYSQCKIKFNWYVLSNTDIQIPDELFFEKFICKYNNDLYKGVIGPNVYAPLKKKYSNPYLQKRPSRKFYISKNIAMTFPNMYDFLFRIKNKMKKDSNKTLKCSSLVYAVHGSFMFVKREILEMIANRSRWELLYDEEQYIAEIASKCKQGVFFDSTLCVMHMEGTSTGKVDLLRRYAMMKKSNKRIMKEFY